MKQDLDDLEDQLIAENIKKMKAEEEKKLKVGDKVMNREIKFRGKRKDNGEWVYGDLIQYKENDYRILESLFGQWDILEGGYEVIPESVGQYTGLKDKNGKEIYEGDIMTFERFINTKNDSIKWEVKYSPETGFKSWHSAPNDAIVIGNIFENPELLANKQ